MNLRLSILLVAVLLIFGGTVLVIWLTGSDDSPPKNPWLYGIDQTSIVHISVSHQDQTVDYQRKTGSTDWFILGDPVIPVFPQKWSGTPLLLSGGRVTRVLADSISDPTSFGLDPPVTKVWVTDRSGNTVEFHLGDPTPDTRHHYATLVGDPALFTVPLSFADEIKRLAITPPYLQLYQLEDQALEYIEVQVDDQAKIYLKNRNTGQWVIEGDILIPVFAEKWGDIPEILSGPRVDQVVAGSVDDLAKYGLDPPETTVRVAIQTGQITEFHLGNSTDDGQYRYASVVGNPRLFAMSEGPAQRITDLAIEPPYPPRASES